MVSSAQQHYLRSLLTQRGPDSLPYSDGLGTLIEQHLLALTQDFPSLLIIPSPFFEDDGTCVQLLQAEGTIPMTFRGSPYNIPITMWLLESYPISSPLVFVSPTSDMVIKPHHQHVSKSGVVSLPYLVNWAYPNSNLADLARSLSRIFGLDPPLFTKVASLKNAIDEFSLASQTSSSHSSPLSSTSNMNDYSFLSPSSSTSSPSSSSSTEDLQMSHNQYIDPSEVFRQNAIKALSARMKLGLAEHQSMRDADMKKLTATEAQLKTRHKKIMLAVDRQQREREALEHKLQILRTNIDVVETWLGANNCKLHHCGEIDVDDVFVPCDALSNQMLKNKSADLALDDVLYSLDKAVHQGVMPMDAYLRHVRTIAREQFFYRATSMKIEAIQRQEQISSIAARYTV
ncbi:hypothetical protein GOP47_0005655 [Adiantum capillus-veneris]|uniref:Protein ELC-like n=1 Tax=Adiantum capillus-veneris TaxID=13818 RepID=A0A9D4V5H1_ADICA|nr:hypothetical protein GOP47_0005655 [Adiantum capillus-veneris]